ncbi:Late embryogenesis abundant protein [Macleaya cordata]|uniref:Late embryogenesis abundant protein n=1 Tax=Macleaya cordata TaxID=56857 RepID=A0A200Q0B2_MACCD|nr:Late embryogenesis abundant protein [Macleaya cordata]
MTDRVHPRDSPPDHQSYTTKPSENMSVPEKPAPPVGTYVVQIPKDQIYRVPPPENAHRYQKYARRKHRRNPCCCCLCWILGIIVLLILLTAVAAGVFYLVFRPKEPNYSVENVSIKGINLTSSSDLTLSPEFDVTVRAENPNKKIGIYYEKGSSVVVSHSNIDLCSGVLPAFYQPTSNVTVFETALKGSGIKLTTTVYNELQEQQKKGKIPLGLDLKVPVKIKVGSVKTWTITAKVHCVITVNKLAMDSKIVSKDCGVGLKLWKD